MKEWDAVEFFDKAHASAVMADMLLPHNEALRALAAEAERRGMLKAAEMNRQLYASGYTALACAAAIERAAKGEG